MNAYKVTRNGKTLVTVEAGDPVDALVFAVMELRWDEALQKQVSNSIADELEACGAEAAGLGPTKGIIATYQIQEVEVIMTSEEARAVFNEVISVESDPDVVAKLELAREWLTNAQFRERLTQVMFTILDTPGGRA